MFGSSRLEALQEIIALILQRLERVEASLARSSTAVSQQFKQFHDAVEQQQREVKPAIEKWSAQLAEGISAVLGALASHHEVDRSTERRDAEWHSRHQHLLQRLEDSASNAVSLLVGQIEQVRLLASRLEPIDERSSRTESRLIEASETMCGQLEAVRLLASNVTPVDERTARMERQLMESVELISGQLESIRSLTSRLEPIDERTSRTESRLLETDEKLLGQLEAVRLLASNVTPVHERTARMERQLMESVELISGQLESIRSFTSRLEPIDERTSRTEAQLLDTDKAMSCQIETVRSLASRIEPVQESIGRIERQLGEVAAPIVQRLSENAPTASEGELDRNLLPRDIVRLHEVCLFVPTDDNLYDRFIPDRCKRVSLEEAIAYASDTGSAQSPQEISHKPADVMLLYLDLLFRQKVAIRFVDIGAWVGDVAIRLARFAKNRGGRLLAECYDPSDAGALIPRNIALNQVRDFVRYKPLAVNLDRKPLIFHQLHHHSDSSRLAIVDDTDFVSSRYLVDTVPFSDCVPLASPGEHVIVKVDVEGANTQLVLENLHLVRNATLIIEFVPLEEADRHSPRGVLIGKLKRTHTIFDLCYLPNPSCVSEVEDPRSFAKDVSQRPYGYTDILAVPRSLPGYEHTVAELRKIEPAPPTYEMA